MPVTPPVELIRSISRFVVQVSFPLPVIVTTEALVKYGTTDETVCIRIFVPPAPTEPISSVLVPPRYSVLKLCPVQVVRVFPVVMK